jgi:antitoxin FitA
MASLTIRDLDDSLKQDLRLRAARHSRSMEEEVRQILRSVLQGSPPAEGNDLAERIRARFADMGGVELVLPPREMPREPPSFDDLVFDESPRPSNAPRRTPTAKPKPRALAVTVGKSPVKGRDPKSRSLG